jgi:hypothetical protein
MTYGIGIEIHHTRHQQMLGNGIYVSTSLTQVGCTELIKEILKKRSLVSDLLSENISLLRFNGRLSGHKFDQDISIQTMGYYT